MAKKRVMTVFFFNITSLTGVTTVKRKTTDNTSHFFFPVAIASFAFYFWNRVDMEEKKDGARRRFSPRPFAVAVLLPDPIQEKKKKHDGDTLRSLFRVVPLVPVAAVQQQADRKWNSQKKTEKKKENDIRILRGRPTLRAVSLCYTLVIFKSGSKTMCATDRGEFALELENAPQLARCFMSRYFARIFHHDEVVSPSVSKNSQVSFEAWKKKEYARPCIYTWQAARIGLQIFFLQSTRLLASRFFFFIVTADVVESDIYLPLDSVFKYPRKRAPRDEKKSPCSRWAPITG